MAFVGQVQFKELLKRCLRLGQDWDHIPPLDRKNPLKCTPLLMCSFVDQ